jgi:hypothetical protein
MESTLVVNFRQPGATLRTGNAGIIGVAAGIERQTGTNPGLGIDSLTNISDSPKN